MIFDLTAIITAIITAAVSIFGTWFAMAGKKKDQEVVFIEKVLSDGLDLRKTLMDMLANNIKLQNEISELRIELDKIKLRLADCEGLPINESVKTILERVMNEIDIPAWVCDVEENQWFLNDAYCQYFKIRRDNFWTPTDVMAIYDQPFISQHMEGNIKVLKLNAPILKKEPSFKIGDEKLDWYTLKIPINSHRKYVLGFCSSSINNTIMKKYKSYE